MMALTTLWPVLIGALVGLAGIVAALFKHKAAQVSKAEADGAKEQLRSVLADTQATQAAQSATQSAKDTRAAIEADIAAKPAGSALEELSDEFTRK